MTRREEIERVKELGEEIGYGNMMDIASALWGMSLHGAYGAPHHHAHIPTCYLNIKKRKLKPIIEAQTERVREIEARKGN